MCQLHLNKSGSGMASKTACGRNVVNTPMSAGWVVFKAEPKDNRCAKCDASKQAELNRRADAKSEDAGLAKWEPVEDENEWMAKDAALIAAHKRKVVA